MTEHVEVSIMFPGSHVQRVIIVSFLVEDAEISQLKENPL